MRLRELVVVTGLCVAACARSTDVPATAPPAASPSPSPSPSPAPSVAATAPSAAASVPSVAPAVTPVDQPVDRPRIRSVDVIRLRAERGEDGAGHTVSASAPVAIDVTADAWLGRALDPVLRVGAMHFHHYEFPSIGVMRFVVADGAVLPTGVPAVIEWGDDAASRVTVANALPGAR